MDPILPVPKAVKYSSPKRFVAPTLNVDLKLGIFKLI
jgi:hypothetical protein